MNHEITTMMNEFLAIANEENDDLAPEVKGAMVTIFFTAVSIDRLINLIKKIYNKEDILNKKPIYIDISDLREEAKNTTLKPAIEGVYIEKSKLIEKSTSKPYGILTMPKEKKITIYQLIGLIGNAIALALSIFSLYSYIISLLGFKNQMKVPFFHRCYILFSPLIVLASIVLQEEILKNPTWILESLKIKTKSIATHTKRDVINFKRSQHYHSTVCASCLGFASFFYLISAYRAPSILGTPIFIVCTNLCFALHKLILDCYYVYNNNILDNKTKLIVMGTEIPIIDNGELRYEKLSQIHVITKVSKLMKDFHTQHSQYSIIEKLFIKNGVTNETREAMLDGHKMVKMQIMILKRAMRYVGEHYKNNENIVLKIKIKKDSTKNPITYTSRLDGDVGIYNGTQIIYQSKNNKTEIPYQYVEYKSDGLEDLLSALDITKSMGITQANKGAVILTELIAIAIATIGRTSFNATGAQQIMGDLELNSRLNCIEHNFEFAMNKHDETSGCREL